MSVLVACASGDESGNGGVVGWLITPAVLGAWLAVTILILRGMARDRSEKRLLLGLLIGSFVLGPLIIAAFYAGYFGSDDSVGKLAVLLLIPGVLGTAIAHGTKAAHAGKAFVVSSWGAVSLVVLVLGLLIVGLLLGGEICLE